MLLVISELVFQERSRLMTTAAKPQSNVGAVARESLDGVGAADHDMPYTFGRLPRALAPFPFSTRQFARLLVLRGQVRAARFAEDQRR
jgi:hypothetical protein